ncbi:MAG TPA: PrsW family glutamic-type intramembrane protease [Thermoanaerobaculia bacterium]|nr:PrsW family glutamic-type intramembrane protease [Thermoanaerobaculia bacterium]HUM30793.1 PrsW family glutamic-type intramembrane protease [Thermoanaerobaculia bacterium]HXK69007.1 PrsW family glutamic-type intramembrane protease [Thermoanaerobaculia bacterium]
MVILGILSLAVAPGLFWLWFFYARSRRRRRPPRLVGRVFVLGMIFSLPVIILESPFLCCGVILAIYAAPLIEELVKFYVVHQGVAYRKEFREPMDGIIYGTAAALGFATVENIFYIIQAYLLDTLVATAVLRTVLSVPGHALWAVMWGYPLGMAAFLPRSEAVNATIVGLILAILCHGAFNLFAVFTPFMGLGPFLVIGISWLIAHRFIRKAQAFVVPPPYQRVWEPKKAD